MRVKEWQGNKRPLELSCRAIKYQINECDCCKERATRSKTQICQKKDGGGERGRREGCYVWYLFQKLDATVGGRLMQGEKKQAMNCQSQRLIDVE
jgi:hypothetical protein